MTQAPLPQHTPLTVCTQPPPVQTTQNQFHNPTPQPPSQLPTQPADFKKAPYPDLYLDFALPASKWIGKGCGLIFLLVASVCCMEIIDRTQEAHRMRRITQADYHVPEIKIVIPKDDWRMPTDEELERLMVIVNDPSRRTPEEVAEADKAYAEIQRHWNEQWEAMPQKYRDMIEKTEPFKDEVNPIPEESLDEKAGSKKDSLPKES